MPGTYSTDVRILTCPGCGAPFSVSPVGGQVACQFCGSQIQVPGRDDTSLGAVAGPKPSEAERQQGMWQQVQTFAQQQLPPEMVAIVSQGPLTSDRAAPAMDLWRSYCEAGKRGDVHAAGLAILMMGSLSSYFAMQNDAVRNRALYETTLDAVVTPAQKQVVRCNLARAAAKAGEPDAAATWLAACDPAATDLLADTSYRTTYAILATLRGDFDGVLAALGPTIGSIPEALTMAILVDVVRANAVERKGDVRGAAAQLVQAARTHQGGPQAVPSVVQANGHLQLCPQSLPVAMREF